MPMSATVYFSDQGKWTAVLRSAREHITMGSRSLEATMDWACGALRSRGGGMLTIKGRDGYIRARASVPPILDPQWSSK